VFSTIASVLSRSVQNSPLATLDGTLGLAFGLARGAVLAALVYIGAALLLPTDRWPPPVLQARLVPYIHETAVCSAALVPQAYRPAVPPPGTLATAAPLPAPLPVQAAATALASGQASRSAQ
jgi:membrane protein required for colicin V production